MVFLGWLYFIDIAQAQNPLTWTPQENIPGFAESANPPVLLRDTLNRVHALFSQPIGGENAIVALHYSRWTLDGGWNEPVDVILPPVKGQARILDALLDDEGSIHTIFFAGDEGGAYVYYSHADMDEADQAQAWSEPVIIGNNANVFESGALVGLDEGNLLAIFSGTSIGPGVYAVTTKDRGLNWEASYPIYLTNDPLHVPSGLKMTASASGLVHAVWDLVDISGVGRAIYYIKYSQVDTIWGNPQILATTDSGLGLKLPNIAEHNNELFVFYYFNGPMIFRRSIDYGESWTDPQAPFPHVGLNGPVSFASDSKNELHVFWGQRISGRPDIHGMWHSRWLGDEWSQFEAVVSGPRNADREGLDAFDPTAPNSTSIDGDVLLVVWRSDYGLRPNGVWYSHTSMSDLISAALPVSLATQNTPTATTQPTVSASATIEIIATEINDKIQNDNYISNTNPTFQVVVSIIPICITVLLIVAVKILSKKY